MNIKWTKHAQERQKQWEKELGITRQEVEETVEHPEQVVPGDLGVLVAQKRRGSGVLRVPFIDAGDEKKIVTVYWTSRIDKYWKAG